MKRKETCKMCNIIFEVYQSRKPATYCGIVCKRKDYKSWHPIVNGRDVRIPKIKPKKIRFTWKTATEEQKLERIKNNFEKLVIRKEGCWDWAGCLHRAGYAPMNFYNNKMKYAHSVSWILHKGVIPEGLLVCHHCDNKKCTNPDHLFLGTTRDNSLDMVKKNRHIFGEKKFNSKLTGLS